MLGHACALSLGCRLGIVYAPLSLALLCRPVLGLFNVDVVLITSFSRSLCGLGAGLNNFKTNPGMSPATSGNPLQGLMQLSVMGKALGGMQPGQVFVPFQRGGLPPGLTSIDNGYANPYVVLWSYAKPWKMDATFFGIGRLTGKPLHVITFCVWFVASWISSYKPLRFRFCLWFPDIQ